MFPCVRIPMKTASQYFGEAERREINDCVRVAEAQLPLKSFRSLRPPQGVTSERRTSPGCDGSGLSNADQLVLASHSPGSWGLGRCFLGPANCSAWSLTVVGFLIGVVIGSRWKSLRRLLTPKRQLQDQVRAAAGSPFSTSEFTTRPRAADCSFICRWKSALQSSWRTVRF